MAADLPRWIPLAALGILLSVAVVGCGGGEGTSPRTDASTSTTTAGDEPPLRSLRAPPCPAVENCERASGEIALVERVDPDGDGDAHFVLVSVESITAPGVSVIDVRVDLRPSPLPRPGDQLAASGPVFTGSFGQRQIQADAVRFRRAEG